MALSFHPGASYGGDRGYQGYEPEAVTTFQPKKKPPRQALSEADKDWNRMVSSKRVEIEHQINGIKRSRIVVHRLRSRRDCHADQVMETACGLCNFRLSHRQLRQSKAS